ncbi:MAG: hypothetical protein ACPLUL_00615 [Thermanaerothrix sp.]|uniref:hypothetical protein n=1 Tax=Thermanaerothrix sp. TaxID=2972675 RepID=UPI003C7BD57A
MSAEIPSWALTFTYWLHMVATVVWIGGIVAINLIVVPLSRSMLTETAYFSFYERLLQRLQSIGWVAIAILTATGLFQMSAHPAYQGFLVIENTWAVAIFLKHIAVAGMVFVSIGMTWGVMPQWKRLNYLLSMGRIVDEASREQLYRRQTRLWRLNLAFSVMVLLLTAWARVS